jgi:hypothetical protein
MPETSLPVEHLFTFTGTVGRGMTIKAGPMGTRVTLRREDGELIAEASAQQALQSYEEPGTRHSEPTLKTTA